MSTVGKPACVGDSERQRDRYQRPHGSRLRATIYIFQPHKFVALVGSRIWSIVDTKDALLIAHRDHSSGCGARS